MLGKELEKLWPVSTRHKTHVELFKPFVIELKSGVTSLWVWFTLYSCVIMSWKGGCLVVYWFLWFFFDFWWVFSAFFWFSVAPLQGLIIGIEKVCFTECIEVIWVCLMADYQIRCFGGGFVAFWVTLVFYLLYI